MMTRSIAICSGLMLGAAVLGGIPSAQALTMQTCSTKYKAAQTAGTLGGMKWNDFRKAQCGSDASAAPAPASAPAAAEPPAAAARPARAKQAAAPAPAATGNAVFPPAVSQKYSTESAGKARMHTCLDQYNVNKAGNANGGLTWIQKGCGYYSECNKRLRG